MKTSFQLALCLSLIWMVSCTSNPKPASPTTFDGFCNMVIPKGQKYPQLYEWEKTQKIRVSLEGYLALPKGFNLTSDTFTILLFENPNRGGKSIKVSMKLGNGRNRLKSPGDKYKLDDLQAKDAQGKSVTNATKVRVHGKRLLMVDRDGDIAKGISGCFMNVDLVEAIQ